MRWIATNIRTFLLALVLAVSVWVSAVTGADPNEVRVFPRPIPLEVIGLDPSLVLTSDIPATIEVTLRAPRSVWDEITTQTDSVISILDLSGLSAGEHTQAVQVQINERLVQIVLTSPQYVTFTLEPLSTQPLAVDLLLTGRTAVGYQAGDAMLDPAQVVISGPEAIVNQAARARVVVNLDNARESVDQVFGVEIVDEKNDPVNGITITPQSVHVNIPVSQQGGFRDVAVKVIVQGQVANGYRLENISVFPPVITIYSSNPELVNTVPGVLDTEPLDLNGARENISTRLSLKLPENVTAVGAQTVEVTVGISPIQTSLTLSNQPVHIMGIPEGLMAQVSPQTLDVIISGPLPVLDALTSQDVNVSVDVSGLAPGTHQLTPKVEVLVSNVLVESILPGTVEVILFVPDTPTPTQTP